MKQEPRDPVTGLRPSDTRGTPEWLVAVCARMAGVTDWALDPCTTRALAKAPWYITLEGEYHGDRLVREGCGLTLPWERGSTFVNPPFSQLQRWTEKCWLEALEDRSRPVVMIMPNTKSEQTWYQTLVRPYDGGGVLQTDDIGPGRVMFCDASGHVIKGSAWFGVRVLMWNCPKIPKDFAPRCAVAKDSARGVRWV